MNQHPETGNEQLAATPPLSETPPPAIIDKAPNFLMPGEDQKENLEKRLVAGASWFYWIAALSLLNSVILLFGGKIQFVFGLGVTQFVDAVALGLQTGTVGQALAFIFDLAAASLFAIFGYLSHKKLRWAFIVGMVLYTLDGLILLLLSSFLSAAVHAYVLYRMSSAFVAVRKLRELDQSSGTI